MWRVHDRRPDFKTVKPIQRVLYDAPLLSAQQMSLWEWIASYYMCSLGEVMRVALPALMKPSGDTEEEFSGDEFRPRTECYVSLAAGTPRRGAFSRSLREDSNGAPRSSTRRCSSWLRPATRRASRRARWPAACSGPTMPCCTPSSARNTSSAPSANVPVERGGSAFRLPELTAHQLTALNALREQFAAGKTTALLQGVTGSGKTEIYIHLIAEVLSRGGDVLLLVPEIALTAQLIERMERIFGSRVTPYHSKLTNRRRTETYLRLNRSDGGEFVVGVRSSVFLPLKHLQLIVVDEEHDASYKQTEPAPRYNARDCAVVMARLTGGRTLLGSATPSLETWLNAASGKYGRAELTQRYGDARPPEILVSDTLRAARRGERKGHFNKLLLDRIGETLDRGGQVMLFQNRRGFSPYVACSECGWTARCPHCNVTLTYHKGGRKLVCHYCGHTEDVPAKCPSCKVTDVLPMGFGTEKVEEEISRIFPEARVARLDRDSVTSEKAFSAIIADFEARRTDILVGTQMITKGFDFAGRVARRHPQCRQPAEQPRFPGRRTGFPADDAGGGPRRTARRRGRGGDPDLRTGASRDPAGRGGRFRGDGPRTARRAQSLFLSALCAAHVAHAAPPRPLGAPKRGHGARRTPAHPFRPPSCWGR